MTAGLADTWNQWPGKEHLGEATGQQFGSIFK